MKRFFALAMALVCLMGSAFAAEDYTVAEKLAKQLWAGSGFSGTLTVEAEAVKDGAFATTRPFVIGLDYIYVRPETEGGEGQHRADLTLLDGENALSAAYLQINENGVSLQADVISPDWYLLDGFSAGSDDAQALSYTGAPGMSRTLAALLAASQNVVGLDDLLDDYITRLDVWIEGYRQSAELGKLADGTTTMEAVYVLSPAAVKAQVKQLVLDLLRDEELLEALAAAVDGDTASLYLNPQLQSWYFDSIDALPLSGDLTIHRTVSLKGDTVNLELSLPLYDAQGGETVLSYSRKQGEGDLPDSHVIRLDSSLRMVEIAYQEYSSMTGVNVVQGTLLSQPSASFTVSDDMPEALGIAFTLKQETLESRDESDRDVYEYKLGLSLAPTGESDFAHTDITLNTRFASKELKSAATEMSAVLTLGGEDWDSRWTLSFEGKSRKKWEPEEIQTEYHLLSEMTEEDVNALLPGVLMRSLELLSRFAATPAKSE